MAKKILELEKNTWIQTYHIRNYELGLLQCKSPWIFSKYINCYYDSENRSMFNHCTPEGRFFAKSKVCFVQKFRFNASIFDLEIIDFVNWIRKQLDNEWYVVGYFDEYYIPHMTCYKKKHFRHSKLIYGYDDKAQLFYAAGYTQERKYMAHCLTYDEFLSSIKIDFDRQKEPYIKTDINKIEFDVFKINSDYSFKFDLKEMYTSLLDYTNCEYCGYRSFNGLVFGLACEKEYINYINMQRGDDLDVRYSRLFMELKELMVKRLKYLSNEQIISPHWMKEYEQICDMQKTIHMLVIKYNLLHEEDIIDHVINIMECIVDTEEIIMPQINREIYGYIIQKYNEEYF